MSEWSYSESERELDRRLREEPFDVDAWARRGKNFLERGKDSFEGAVNVRGTFNFTATLATIGEALHGVGQAFHNGTLASQALAESQRAYGERVLSDMVTVYYDDGSCARMPVDGSRSSVEIVPAAPRRAISLKGLP